MIKVVGNTVVHTFLTIVNLRILLAQNTNQPQKNTKPTQTTLGLWFLEASAQ